ncbi:hypothetical protein GPZ77_34230 (plasmid) [Streptomyces sp. QHH-9511]|uniref:hypothetical protein n=1 Tax=Streptomyces sp. QHH-9511 TaxID=2684468 RepID=UPI001316F94C|nr:hypothetical protein [Streptomyces sp. QHH-9511]QGZ53290.1 hypothetical protein GPZ77_34230 [Streptomyces sp. QHH-9511]
MTTLMVEIDDKTVPLNSCGWLQREKCGCIVAALVAVPTRGIVYATAQQAHQHLSKTKRERDEDDRAGRYMELITMAHYRENIRANWECSKHQPGASGD